MADPVRVTGQAQAAPGDLQQVPVGRGVGLVAVQTTITEAARNGTVLEDIRPPLLFVALGALAADPL
jgi:hypothetical protein